eukprot:EG_transcript_3343
MGSLSWLQSLVRFDRFDSAALEARYQREYYRSSVQACRTWATAEVAVMLTNISTAVAFSPSQPLMYWALYSIQIGGVLAMLFVVRSHSRPVRHLKDILCACYCLCLATFGAQMCVALQQQQLYNWGLSTALEGDVVHFLEAAMSFLYMCHYFVLYQPLTVPMLQLGFCPSSLAAILCGPTVYILMMTVGMGFTVTTLAFLPTCLLIVGLQLFYCRRIAIMRRAMFLLEAQKSRHMQEVREADSVINHIVKNTMSEAAGLMEMFLELCSPPPPMEFVKPYLNCALERLRSGMAWCKRRRALLELMDPETRPKRTLTALPALGAALASNRTMATDFANLVVELDEALVDMMLENAISNAFRHGHPTDPAVHFLIVADVLDAAAGSCAVTFRITNRCDPTRQPLQPKFLEQLRCTDYSELTSGTPFCQGLGLRHCLLAAELQGMTVSLAQQGDLVVFQASVVTKAVSPPAPDRNAHPGTPMAAEGVVPPLPFGLRIAVMDDSASARTLLHHQLCQDVPGCVVDVFGASAADVAPFLRHTVAAADVAILDRRRRSLRWPAQHLDWPCGSVGLGTDLVRLLLQAGFRGLICIRSANMSEEDTHQYFAAGAHCVLDKLLSRSQTTATLATQYWRFFAAAQGRPTPGDEPAAASQCLLIPGMVSLM